MKRCPIHGRVHDETTTVCPVKIRRTIAGEVVPGTCDMPLEPEDDD